MKTKQTKYTPPPDAIYNLGKRKERATNTIKLLKTLLIEDLEGHPTIQSALEVMNGYRKSLDEV
jgi:uncharacterized alpha-E superfamily protein